MNMTLIFFSMVQEASTLPNDVKPTITKSGRKIKGRGTMVISHSCLNAAAFILLSLTHFDC